MFKKLKEYIDNRKQKKLDYWAKLDLEREEKIEKIKKSRSERYMKDSKSLLLQALFLLIVLLIVPIYMYITSHVDFNNVKEASSDYAEEINISNVAYEDVVNDSNAIVNFNQWVKLNFNTTSSNGTTFTKIDDYTFRVNGTATDRHYEYIASYTISFNENDKFYFYVSNDSIDNFNYGVNLGGYTNPTESAILTAGSGSGFDIWASAWTGFSGDYTIHVNLINLTQMFGSGNEPDLQQCKDLFVADYYNYDTGSAVSLSGLNAYAEGVQSVYETLTYNYVGEDSYNLLQPYAFYRGATYYNGAPSKEQSHISVASVDGDGWSSGNGFALYYPFTSSLVAGDTIVLNGMLGSATDLGSHQQATTYIIIRYGENIYDVLSVNNIVLQDATTNNINSFTYTLPSDATGLVFYSVQPFRIKDLTIQIKSLSINNLIDSAYKNGYDKGSNPYQLGNNGYNQIFEAGRLQGVEDAGNYTFLSLLTTAIDVPINSVLHMLDFDLLGMNMKSFYLSMFTFAIILFVIKLLI